MLKCHPYSTGPNKTLHYNGNQIYQSSPNVLSQEIDLQELLRRVVDIPQKRMWRHIMTINDQIFTSSVQFFSQVGSKFVPLPLTTRMISSPGAVYGRERINYTTDTCPITLDWFREQTAFLAESSQIYLELSLLTPGVDHVYCIYNSFRKEEADATHLPEFRHVEYEGHALQPRNKEIALNLILRIVDDLLNHPAAPLEYFLRPEQLRDLSTLRKCVYDIEFAVALDALRRETGDDTYREFTLKHFGSWEEVRLTEIYEGLVLVNHFPLLEVPFYHAIAATTGPNGEQVAENTDVIWPGYREVLGSGQRIGGLDDLKYKAAIFNLPEADYAPYIQSRRFEDYQISSGFGLGWERILQGVLCLPFIYTGVMFPRTHLGIRP